MEAREVRKKVDRVNKIYKKQRVNNDWTSAYSFFRTLCISVCSINIISFFSFFFFTSVSFGLLYIFFTLIQS